MSSTAAKPIVKLLSDVVVDSDYTFSKPYKMQDGTRFSACRGPLVQTCELPVTINNGMATILCSDNYAEYVAQVEEQAIDALATNSEKWFQKRLSHEDIEQLMKPSIKGHRCPKHILSAKAVKCYDHDLQPVDEMPATGTNCIAIIQVEGLKLDERRSEVCFAMQQLKLVEVPVEEETEVVTLDGPAFV